jgi:3-oxoacyl-[acyl-carrier protein] reductase
MMFEGKPLAGRTALVTGSGRNIGRAIVKLFARAGANVVVNGHRDKAAVDGVVKEITDAGGNAIGIMADVADHKAIEQMVESTVKEFGTIDIAINNVAIRRVQKFLEISVDDWHSILNSNLNASFYMARTVIPRMRERGWGRIISISGQDGFNPHSNTRAHNIVCKAGVHTLTRVLSNEFAKDGLTINTVAPGRTDTARDLSIQPPNYLANALKGVPKGRFAHVDEIANACLFLAAETGAFITGQVIHVNGGESTFSS